MRIPILFLLGSILFAALALLEGGSLWVDGAVVYYCMTAYMLFIAGIYFLLNKLNRKVSAIRSYVHLTLTVFGLFLVAPFLRTIVQILSMSDAPDSIAFGSNLLFVATTALGTLLFIAGQIVFIITLVKSSRT